MFKKIIFTYLFIFALVSNSNGQEKRTISGTITNVNSNETLIGVNIGIPSIKVYTTTNE
jgi:hypothetical protein